jgi:hypothetical protein
MIDADPAVRIGPCMYCLRVTFLDVAAVRQPAAVFAPLPNAGRRCRHAGTCLRDRRAIPAFSREPNRNTIEHANSSGSQKKKPRSENQGDVGGVSARKLSHAKDATRRQITSQRGMAAGRRCLCLAGRSAGAATGPVRVGYEPQESQGPRPHRAARHSALAAIERGQ